MLASEVGGRCFRHTLFSINDFTGLESFWEVSRNPPPVLRLDVGLELYVFMYRYSQFGSTASHV